MEQPEDDLARRLDLLNYGPPPTSHAAPDPDSKEPKAEHKIKRKPLPPPKIFRPETLTVNPEFEGERIHTQPFAAVDSPFSARAGTVIANNSGVIRPPTTNLIGKKTSSTPVARYITHRQAGGIGDQDIPVFGWYLTSPEGNTTWMYIT